MAEIPPARNQKSGELPHIDRLVGQTLNEWAAVKSTKLTFFYLSRCVSFTCDFL